MPTPQSIFGESIGHRAAEDACGTPPDPAKPRNQRQIDVLVAPPRNTFVAIAGPSTRKIFEHVEMKMQIRLCPQRMPCVLKS